jgi:hypothetical protein
MRCRFSRMASLSVRRGDRADRVFAPRGRLSKGAGVMPEGNERRKRPAAVRTRPPARKAGRSSVEWLRRFEPVSDELVLAGIERAERHRHRHRTFERGGVWLADIAAHLGFVDSSWTTRQLRLRLGALASHGLLVATRRKSLDLWALTDTGRARLEAARLAGTVDELPESPQHRAWRRGCVSVVVARSRQSPPRASSRACSGVCYPAARTTPTSSHR